jgi:Na+/H+-translocating membrane pyrophosphatase
MRVGVVMVSPFRSRLVPVMILCAQPLAVIAVGMWIAYAVDGGLYGVAATMLSVAGTVVAVDSYAPVTDNAGGIA